MQKIAKESRGLVDKLKNEPFEMVQQSEVRSAVSILASCTHVRISRKMVPLAHRSRPDVSRKWILGEIFHLKSSLLRIRQQSCI